MKIVVLGAGALGSWFGGKLASVHPKVTLLTTNQEHLNAINQNGLILRDPQGEERVDVKAMHPIEFNDSVDVLLLLTKTFQSSAALASIAESFAENTAVLTLQNGLGNLETISSFIPESRIMLGNTMMPVDKVAPGILESHGEGATWIGNLSDETTDIGLALTDLMNSVGLNISIDDNIQRRIWHKVAFNSGMNAAAALAHGTPGTIGDSPGALNFVLAVATETISVAKAHGVDIEFSDVRKTIEGACNEHRDHKPSMLQDLVAGRATEVDALNGAIVEFGRRKNVETPLNQMLTTLVKLAELSHSRYHQS